jgi:hypothetical protein
MGGTITIKVPVKRPDKLGRLAGERQRRTCGRAPA